MGCGGPGVCLRLSLTQSGGRGGDAGDKRMQKRAATCHGSLETSLSICQDKQHRD